MNSLMQIWLWLKYCYINCSKKDYDAAFYSESDAVKVIWVSEKTETCNWAIISAVFLTVTEFLCALAKKILLLWMGSVVLVILIDIRNFEQTNVCVCTPEWVKLFYSLSLKLDFCLWETGSTKVNCFYFR